jgi:hypothetical protein
MQEAAALAVTSPARTQTPADACHTGRVCAQCMATAAAAIGGASGLRAWLAARDFSWVTPTRLRRVTYAVGFAAVLVAATFSGTGS